MTTGLLLHRAGGRPATLTEREPVGRQVFAAMRALIRLGYFSFEVVGQEHLPKTGSVVYAMNHAGWFALDTFFVALAVSETIGMRRVPYFAAHDAALATPLVGPFFRRLGTVPASWIRHPERLPPEIESYGICPEGVRGNCKPFWQAYRMREWSRGFVRLAIARNASIVPVAVFGGEECLPVAWTVKALEPFIGSVVGFPLVPFPLPARWKVVFQEPIRVATPGRRMHPDPSYCADVARRIQKSVQQTLDQEGAHRPLARLSSLVTAVVRWRGEAQMAAGSEALQVEPAPVPVQGDSRRLRGDVSERSAHQARTSQWVINVEPSSKGGAAGKPARRPARAARVGARAASRQTADPDS